MSEDVWVVRISLDELKRVFERAKVKIEAMISWNLAATTFSGGRDQEMRCRINSAGATNV